jgi:uncharacterized protein Smg (DUF494 family)
MDTKMYSRVIDAVGLIHEFVADHWENIIGQNEVHEELMSQGFSQQEISRAFRLIEEQVFQSAAQVRTKTAVSNRVMTAQEKVRISTGAFGFLLRLQKRGVVEHMLFEDIVERAVRSADPIVGLRQMRRLAALALYRALEADVREHLASGSHSKH